MHSIGLTPDGTRLLALNTTESRLAVFNVSDATNPVPVLEMEIPVGIEPVSLRARTNDEIWVVNEVSDSVSIVSLSRGTVVATLQASDEPADVVFAQRKAFVSCARNNLLRVFDAVTRQPLATFPLEGNYPRALATNAAGDKVFAAFLLSGNRTTLLDRTLAPPQPAPTNPALPPAPQTALIVAADDPRIPFTVLDRDVAEVDAAAMTVTRYIGGVGTHLFDIAVHPLTGDFWVTNSDSRNLVRFEPALRGHVADHRLTRIDATTGVPATFDLNPGIDYSVLPNPAAVATALSQPTAVVFTADGSAAWVAAFGSDRIVKIATATATVTAAVDMRGAGETSRQMRGPRALALHESSQRLFVMNRISNTVSVVSTASLAVVGEAPVSSYDPTPADIKQGRGFLFDARLSGNGTVSCATCHLDGDGDGLAWDLGDPGGEMVTVMGANLSAHDPTPRPRVMHPMKGPMVTQTLRALIEGAPFHWRGDRSTLQSFNPTFDKLMGGPELPTADIDSLSEYLRTLMPHPNPNRTLDNKLPTTLQGGDPLRGQTLFNSVANHCLECHSDHAGGTNNIDLHAEVGSSQPVKNPPLRSVYQRTSFNPQPGAISRSGFGMLHDGSGFLLPTVHPYALDALETAADFADLRAFILCFDTGMPAETGASRTVTQASSADPAILNDIAKLQARAAFNFSEFNVYGNLGGRRRSFDFDSWTGRYMTDDASDPSLSINELLALLGPDDAITFVNLPYGWGYRRGMDRDFNFTLNGNEPFPSLSIGHVGAGMRLQWPAQATGWKLESAASPAATWETVTRTRSTVGSSVRLDDPIDGRPSRFYRLHRTW